MRKLRQKLALNKVLIAHRGEVALRVQAVCHSRGIATVVVYGPCDRHAAFVRNADEAYAVSQEGYQAYTDVDALIALAYKVGADAVHPGYGFLSEKADAAQKVVDAGLTWIGPNPRVIALMADKIAARDCMRTAGVPVVPGIVITDFSPEGLETAHGHVGTLGFPVMVKDPYGGGGKAMQCVWQEHDFKNMVKAVHTQAARFTGSSAVLVEKCIERSRHVEVQIAGDGRHCVHLFERECSVQRRHQKIIEETPCTFVPAAVLERMYQATLCAAQSVAYDSIGTVEFIVTPDNEFYFLEMNARLQVEHAITEMVTGIDLVALQLALASGEALILQQNEIHRRGHAIECRIYAEDPASNFVPSTGVVTYCQMPSQPFTRTDHDVYQGAIITPFFDPMIAKCISWGATRSEAIARMHTLLQAVMISGITTNRDFLRAVITSQDFAQGSLHTQRAEEADFVHRMLAGSEISQEEEFLAGLAVMLMLHERERNFYASGENGCGAVRGWKEQLWR